MIGDEVNFCQKEGLPSVVTFLFPSFLESLDVRCAAPSQLLPIAAYNKPLSARNTKGSFQFGNILHLSTSQVQSPARGIKTSLVMRSTTILLLLCATSALARNIPAFLLKPAPAADVAPRSMDDIIIRGDDSTIIRSEVESLDNSHLRLP